MKNILIILSLMLSQFGMTQSATLNINKMVANVHADTYLFKHPNMMSSRYGVTDPNGLVFSTIYNSKLWVGAKDQNNSIHVSSNKYSINGNDFKFGPVANNYTNQGFIDKYNKVYSVTAAQIQTHKNQWHQSNYVMPNDIANWPGNGDMLNGEAALLGPFVDNNGNNIYEPQLGDYPLIRGEKTVFFISNDNNGNHPDSGKMNLDMEYHFMLYQYAVNGFLDSTTFINLKVINRSQETYDQLIVGNYVDFDLGGAQDDYIGSSIEKNMIYVYNGDAIDDAGTDPIKFGMNPPACGVKLLNHPINVAGVFNTSGGITGDPNLDSTIWYALNAKWQNGAPYTYGGNGIGGNTPYSFMYDGNPNDSSEWSELTSNNNPGSRRAFFASPPINSFAPGDFICYDYAVLYSRTGGNNLLNVNGLLDVADSAQLFYNEQQHFYCQQVVLGTDEIISQTNDFSLYPNPTQDQFTIAYEGHYDLSIIDLNGKTVYQQLNNVNQVNFDIDIPNGIYIVKVNSNEKTNYTKLIINK